MNLSNAVQRRAIRRTSTLRRLLALSTTVLIGACDSGDDYPTPASSPTGSAAVPAPLARGTVDLAGTLYRVESDDVFYVQGYRVTIPPAVAVSKPLVEGSYVRVRGAFTDGVVRAAEIIVLGDGPSYQLDGQIEAIDLSAQTLRLLGIEFSANGTVPSGFGIGHWVSVRAHRNRFVHSISRQFGTFVNHSAAEGAWFKDVTPPFAFGLDSVVDFTALVFPTTRFLLTYRYADGDCYGADPISGDEFWRRAGEPRPTDGPLGSATIYAVGRFEGGTLIAHEVWLCYP